jgi:hypothetical protein
MFWGVFSKNKRCHYGKTKHIQEAFDEGFSTEVHSNQGKIGGCNSSVVIQYLWA